LLAIVLVLIAAGAVYTLWTSSSPETASTISTQYSADAASVVTGAVAANPAGYVLESSKSGQQRIGDWAVLGQPDGSVANVTVLVFASTSASQSYYSRLVSSLRSLPGYTDLTSSLAQYQQFGRCYGYGEDVDGIAVADGVCTKGNVLLHVHTVSSKAFTSLEADMIDLMGALYQNVD
jgi:hypothetical protein